MMFAQLLAAGRSVKVEAEVHGQYNRELTVSMKKGKIMGKFVFGMQQSLDGYIAGPTQDQQYSGTGSGDVSVTMGAPGPLLFRHFTEHVGSVTGMLYGRRIYEMMRYWENDDSHWGEAEHEFARVWRQKPKWVASRSLKSVGSNATLVPGDLADFAKKLKAEQEGEIDVAGADLASSLSAAGLIDEYRLYFRPYVLGAGKPYFAGWNVPKLRLLGHEAIDDEVVRLLYTPV